MNAPTRNVFDDLRRIFCVWIFTLINLWLTHIQFNNHPCLINSLSLLLIYLFPFWPCFTCFSSWCYVCGANFCLLLRIHSIYSEWFLAFSGNISCNSCVAIIGQDGFDELVTNNAASIKQLYSAVSLKISIILFQQGTLLLA